MPNIISSSSFPSQYVTAIVGLNFPLRFACSVPIGLKGELHTYTQRKKGDEGASQGLGTSESNSLLYPV